MKEDQYKYIGKRSTGNEPCMIDIIPADERKPIGTFKACPNWNQYTYTLYPADQTTYRLYGKRKISMHLVRKYK